MHLKITNPSPERKVFARLFWWAGWSLLLAGHDCAPPSIVHIRRVIAWDTHSSERLEVEFLRHDQQDPTLLFTRRRPPHTQVASHQEKLSPPTSLSPKDPLYPLFSNKLPSDPDAIERAVWMIAQRIAARRWPSPNKMSRWRWLSPPTRSLPLKDLRISLDVAPLLSIRPQIRANWPTSAPLFVHFRASQEDAPHLALSLFPAYHRPLTPPLADPQRARFRRLSCHRRWCLIEIDYGPDRIGNWITQRYVWPLDTQLAQLFHARGHRAHDQKRYREAAQDFARASRLDPQLSDARYNLACAYSLLGRFEQAIALLKPLLQQPAYRKLACKDNDFAPLQKIPHYAVLLSCFAPTTRPTSAPASRSTSTPKL